MFAMSAMFGMFAMFGIFATFTLFGIFGIFGSKRRMCPFVCHSGCSNWLFELGCSALASPPMLKPQS
jgi:hypothetical protein